jgi:hypothetical protein
MNPTRARILDILQSVVPLVNRKLDKSACLAELRRAADTAEGATKLMIESAMRSIEKDDWASAAVRIQEEIEVLVRSSFKGKR